MFNSVLYIREVIGVLVFVKRFFYIIKVFEWDLSVMF